MYDVAVVGGGIAGSMAALGAARAGASVILIERYGFAGGTLAACGTGPMMTFHAGEIKAVQGVTDELIERLKEKDFSPGHIFDTTGYTYSVTPFSAEGMKLELDNMLLEAGVKLLYHSTVCDVVFKNKELKAVKVCGKNGIKEISARIFVDASGDCDLSVLCGLPYSKGRESDGKCQPMTMNFKLTNVDIESVKQYIMTHNEEFPRLRGDLEKVTRSCRLSIGGYVETLRAAQDSGEISFDREDILFFETNTPGEVIVNTTRVINADPTEPEELTYAETIGRKQVWEVYNLLKTKVQGFGEAQLEFSGPFIGIRSSRQIVGLYTLSEYDIIDCTEFTDTIARGGYPIDIHAPEGMRSDAYDRTKHMLNYGDIYSIPYRSLVPKGAKNIITAGRCISASFEAQAAIRVSPIAGATGHAAGVAAAVCVKNETTAPDADINEIRAELLRQGAYLG